MRVHAVLIASALGLLIGRGAQALTYDSHVSANAATSAAFEDAEPDQGVMGHFSVTGGGESSDESDAGNSQFLGSSDHNFSLPQPGTPFGGLIPGQEDR